MTSTTSNNFAKASSAVALLLGGSLVWSLLAIGFQMLATLQLLLPLLNRWIPLSLLGYGRLTPAATFLLTYGWIGGGLLGVLMILVPRFSSIPFRYGRLLTLGALLWHSAILIGLTQLLFEGGSGIPSLAFPRFVSILFLISFLILGTGITRGLAGTWKSGPLLPRLYLLGSLIAFPLGLGTSELLLRGSTAPGAVQIIAQLFWHALLHHLWLTPMALVLLFQLLPTLTGRSVSSLPLGLFSWAATLFLGCWLGLTLVTDGPVPSWLQSAGVVATLLIFVAALGNALLFLSLLENRMEEIRRNVALRFFAVGAWAYVAYYSLLAFLTLPGVRYLTAFTVARIGLQSFFLFLFLGSVLAGAIYALLPASWKMGWPSHPALTWHFWSTTIGATCIATSLILAGIFQGFALNDPGVPISTLSSYLCPFLFVTLLGQFFWLIGQVAFAALFASTLLKLFPSTAPMALFPNPPEPTNPLFPASAS